VQMGSKILPECVRVDRCRGEKSTMELMVDNFSSENCENLETL